MRLKLNGRVDALEQRIGPKFKGGVFIRANRGDDPDRAVRAWEVANGPLDGLIPIVWTKFNTSPEGSICA